MGTKKNEILLKTRTASLTRSQKEIEKIIAIHSSNPSKKKKANQTKNVPLQHSFNSFGKWCSFPQELFNVKKTGNAGHAFDDQRETTTYFYLTEERRRTYTSPTSMLLVILFYKVPAVFNIFVVKYNPVSQSTKIDFLVKLISNIILAGWSNG